MAILRIQEILVIKVHKVFRFKAHKDTMGFLPSPQPYREHKVHKAFRDFREMKGLIPSAPLVTKATQAPPVHKETEESKVLLGAFKVIQVLLGFRVKKEELDP